MTVALTVALTAACHRHGEQLVRRRFEALREYRAVALSERIGSDRNIAVACALQDDVERYAINTPAASASLRRSSDAMPYNEALQVGTGIAGGHWHSGRPPRCLAA